MGTALLQVRSYRREPGRSQIGAGGWATHVYTDSYTPLMSSSRMLRVHADTHAAFLAEAQRRGQPVDAVARAAIRALHRERMGIELASALDPEERAWLDADLG